MRSNLLFALCLSAAPLGAQVFNITGAALQRTRGAAIVLDVYYSGQLPADVATASHWVIRASDANGVIWTGSPYAFPPSSRAIAIQVPASICQGLGQAACRPAVQGYKWQAAYAPPGAYPLVATSVSQPAAAYAPAAKKDEADLYFNGSFAAGVGSSPLYVIDAKLNRFWDLTNQIGGYVGFTSSFIANEGGKLPNKRTRIDPDSVRGAFTLEFVKERNWGPVYGVITQVDLPAGEFSRKEPMSNLVGAGYCTFVLKPLKGGSAGRVFATLDPVIGIEYGRNLNSPDVLFTQPVDLSGYTRISRFLGGAKAMFGVLRSDEGRSFDIQASYRVRAVNAPELMVRYTGGEAFPEVNSAPRHFVDVSVNAAITKYAALTVAYKRGALPPLFKMMSNQVTVGFTIQAKQRNKGDLSGRL
jgi:hypothetical protein